MAGVMFYGSGAVYVPGSNKFIHFVDGQYETVDADEIALLAKKYRHDRPVESLYVEPIDCSDDKFQLSIESILKNHIEVAINTDDKPKRGRKPKNESAES